MTQIFYIEHGEYSDYSVYGVTLDRDLAEQWAEHLNRNRTKYEDPYEVSEGVLLDAPPILVTQHNISCNWTDPYNRAIQSWTRSVPMTFDTAQDPEVTVNDHHISVSGYNFNAVEARFNEERATWVPRTRTSSS